METLLPINQQQSKYPKLNGIFPVLSFTVSGINLKIDLQNKNEPFTVLVDARWLTTTDIPPKTKVLINATYDEKLQFYRVEYPSTSLDESLFIVEPDILVSPQRIDKYVACARKEIFSNYFVAPLMNAKKSDFIVGKLLHSIMEKYIQAGCADLDKIKIKEVEAQMPTILTAGYKDVEIISQIDEVIYDFSLFVREVILKTEVKGTTVKSVKSAETSLISYQHGIKGQVDLTVTFANDYHESPMEIKTGNSFDYHMSHIQVMLYALMLGQIQGSTAPFSIVLYLRKNKLKVVDFNIKEVVAILEKRNQIALNAAGLAKDITKYRRLPEMTKKKEICTNCPYLKFCNYHRENFEDFPENNKYFKLTALSKYYYSYFLNEINKLERVEVSKLAVQEYVVTDYEIQKSKNSSKITISSETLTLSQVVISKIRIKFRESFRYLTLRSVSFSSSSSVFIVDENIEAKKALVFEIENFDNVPFKIMRGNVYKLATDEDSTFNKTIVKQKGQFYPSTLAEEVEKIVSLNFTDPFNALSFKAQNAFKKAATAETFFSLVGDKKTEIKEVCLLLVRVLLATGKKVLLTAYDSAILDDFIGGLADLGESPFRVLGNEKAKQKIKRYCIDVKKESSTKRVQAFNESHLIACPLRLIENFTLGNKRFDVALILNSNNCFEPLILSPILRAEKFILAGEKPVLTMTAGFVIKPLFYRILERHSGAVVCLDEKSEAVDKENRRSNGKWEIIECKAGQENKVLEEIRKKSGIFKKVKVLNLSENENKAVDWGIINCNKEELYDRPLEELRLLFRGVKEKMFFLVDSTEERHGKIKEFLVGL